jgi:hypothetical protein
MYPGRVDPREDLRPADRLRTDREQRAWGVPASPTSHAKIDQEKLAVKPNALWHQ